MFDFAWSEIALIGVVALVLIGPKDMPVAVKAVSDLVKKARRMASELQGHVDEMVKDTSIAEVRQQINEIRNFDVRGEIERAVDADGSIRSTLADDPFRNIPGRLGDADTSHVPAAEPHAIARPTDVDMALLATPAHEVFAPDAPAFVPPAFVPTAFAPPAPAVAEPERPAFIPPSMSPPGT